MIVFVIALGSGAVTTIFSAMNAVVLRPLPGVADVDRLVALPPGAAATAAKRNRARTRSTRYLRDRTRTLDGIAAWGRVSLTIAAGGRARSSTATW